MGDGLMETRGEAVLAIEAEYGELSSFIAGGGQSSSSIAERLRLRDIITVFRKDKGVCYTVRARGGNGGIYVAEETLIRG